MIMPYLLVLGRASALAYWLLGGRWLLVHILDLPHNKQFSERYSKLLKQGRRPPASLHCSKNNVSSYPGKKSV